MREVLEKFKFDDTICKLDEAGLLFKVVERLKTVDFHPDKVFADQLAWHGARC